jgi:hypothetical protein
LDSDDEDLSRRKSRWQSTGRLGRSKEEEKAYVTAWSSDSSIHSPDSGALKVKAKAEKGREGKKSKEMKILNLILLLFEIHERANNES